MTRRVILGQHPAGPIGLFVSRPGIDVFTADPASISDLSFSTEWGQVASVVMSGYVSINQAIALPSFITDIPAMWWCDAAGPNSLRPFSFFQYESSYYKTLYQNSRFKAVWGGAPGSRIVYFTHVSPYDGTGATFKYVIFNLE